MKKMFTVYVHIKFSLFSHCAMYFFVSQSNLIMYLICYYIFIYSLLKQINHTCYSVFVNICALYIHLNTVIIACLFLSIYQFYIYIYVDWFRYIQLVQLNQHLETHKISKLSMQCNGSTLTTFFSSIKLFYYHSALPLKMACDHVF